MSHLFSLISQKPDEKNEAGSRIRATKSNFPKLESQSLYRLTLAPKAIREAHWHANADELGFVVKGTLLITFYANGNELQQFKVEEGDAFLIPSGALHLIENRAASEAELILQFSNSEPEDFALSKTFTTFSNSVLGNTWDLPASHFANWKRPKEEIFAALPLKEEPLSKNALYPSAYCYQLAKAEPLVQNSGGSAKVARRDVWPALSHQALYLLNLNSSGMREPHWHPETSEMGYILKGKGRMSVLSPKGNIDTYEMGPGDLYFIPEAYPHHIENLTDEDLTILVFFNNPLPGDIGFTGSIRALPKEGIAASLSAPLPLIETLPAYRSDLLIVPKKNPQDP